MAPDQGSRDAPLGTDVERVARGNESATRDAERLNQLTSLENVLELRERLKNLEDRVSALEHLGGL